MMQIKSYAQALAQSRHPISGIVVETITHVFAVFPGLGCSPGWKKGKSRYSPYRPGKKGACPIPWASEGSALASLQPHPSPLSCPINPKPSSGSCAGLFPGSMLPREAKGWLLCGVCVLRGVDEGGLQAEVPMCTCKVPRSERDRGKGGADHGQLYPFCPVRARNSKVFENKFKPDCRIPCL